MAGSGPLAAEAEVAEVEVAEYDLGASLKTRHGLEILTTGDETPHLGLIPYGQINVANIAWEDGAEEDDFIVDVNPSSSRLGLIARFDLGPPGGEDAWSLGFQGEVGIDHAGSSTVRASNGNRNRFFVDGDSRLFTRMAKGWVDGPYGRLGVGKAHPVIANWVPNPGRTYALDNASFFLVAGAFQPRLSEPTADRRTLTRPWSAYAAPMQWTLPKPVPLIRYDSPRIAGLKFSMAKALDDIVDVGINYKADVLPTPAAPDGRLALEAAIAFHKNSADGFDQARIGFPEFEESVLGGVGVRDHPTGLFLGLGAGYRHFDGTDANDLDTRGERRPDDFGLWGQAGLRRNLLGIGDTVIYAVAGYGHDRGVGRVVPNASGARWLETRVVMAGLNVIQEIDAARMLGMRLDLYAGVRRWTGDFRRTTSGTDETAMDEPVEPLDLLVTGVRWRF